MKVYNLSHGKADSVEDTVRRIRSHREIKYRLLSSLSQKKISDIELSFFDLKGAFSGNREDFPKSVLLTKKQTKRYKDVPPCYFSSKEALIIGLNFKFHTDFSDFYVKDGKTLSYMAYAAEDTSNESFLANYCLGHYFYDGAIQIKDKQLREPFLQLGLKSFINCLKSGQANFDVLKKIGVIKTLLGKYKLALKFFNKAIQLNSKDIIIKQMSGIVKKLIETEDESEVRYVQRLSVVA